MHAAPLPSDRQGLAAVAVCLLVTASGCSAVLGGPLTFTASPASVCEEAVAETGYEADLSTWRNATRTVEVAGVSREVMINSHLQTYERPGSNESTPAGGFGVLATPQAGVAGQALNPIADWSSERLVRELAARLPYYGEIRDLSRAGSYSLTVLGTESAVTVFQATGTDANGSTTDLVIHVTRVRHGGDILVVGGVHEAGNAGERDRIRALFTCLEHAGSTTTTAPAGTGETPTAAQVDLREADLPPGVSRTGVVNGTQLLAAHRAAGLTTPYRVRIDPVSPDADRRIRITRGEDRLAVGHVTATGTATYWATASEGGQILLKTGDGVTAASPGTPAADRLASLASQARTALAPFVRFGVIETVGAVERGGQRFVKLRVTGLDTQGLAASPLSVGGPNATVQEVSGTLLVTPEGVVRSARLEVTLDTAEEGRITDRFRYRLDRVTADALNRPEWARTAPRVTATYENASVIAVRTASGSIPAGTTITVVGDGARLATVTVPEQVETGEVLYIAGSWTTVETDLALSAAVGQPPAAPATPVDFRAYSSLVVVGQGPNGNFQTRVNRST